MKRGEILSERSLVTSPWLQVLARRFRGNSITVAAPWLLSLVSSTLVSYPSHCPEPLASVFVFCSSTALMFGIILCYCFFDHAKKYWRDDDDDDDDDDDHDDDDHDDDDDGGGDDDDDDDNGNDDDDDGDDDDDAAAGGGGGGCGGKGGEGGDDQKTSL